MAYFVEDNTDKLHMIILTVVSIIKRSFSILIIFHKEKITAFELFF